MLDVAQEAPQANTSQASTDAAGHGFAINEAEAVFVRAIVEQTTREALHEAREHTRSVSDALDADVTPRTLKEFDPYGIDEIVVPDSAEARAAEPVPYRSPAREETMFGMERDTRLESLVLPEPSSWDAA